MKDIQNQLVFNVALTLTCSDDNYEINETATEIIIPLTEEQTHIRTNAKVIGRLKDQGYVEASLAISYHYEPALNLITLYGNDFVSERSPKLFLSKVGDHRITTINSFEPKDGLQEQFRQWLRSANDEIIKYVEDSGLNVVIRTPVPDIDFEILEDLKVVHYKGKMLEIFNPEKEYDSDHTVFHYESVHHGIGKLAEGEKFANVIGSTPDPDFSMSWLKLWRNSFGEPECCTSQNYPDFVACNTSLVGGHCIRGTQARRIEPGSDLVFITPICKAHNNNDNVHMMPLKNGRRIIVLKGYLQG